jgi:LCP family protein required for cell wall assembly
MTGRSAVLVLFGLWLCGCSALAPPHAPVIPPPKGTPTALAAGTPGPTPSPRMPAVLPTGVAREWLPPLTLASVTPPPTPVPTPVAPLPVQPDVTNILLVGSDRRSGTSFRTDTLILASVDRESATAVLISIPRDLLVYLPGYTLQRINSAFYYGETLGYPGGGQAMLADALLYNLGLTVHYQARVEMDGFRQLMDGLDGIDVAVACPFTDWRLRSPELSPDDEDNWALFTVPPGIVHMDGDQALWYARSRSRSSDFDRARRQQEVLRAVYRRLLSLDVLARLPDLYADLTSLVSTDLPLGVLLQLAALTPQLGPAEIRSRYITREHVRSWRVPTSGAQVLIPEADAIRALLEEAFDFATPDPLIPRTFVTVEVVNRAAQPEWGRLAGERLSYGGYRAYVRSSVSEGGSATVLVDYGLAPLRDRERLLRFLGLSPVRLESLPDPQSPFQFRLIVGDDYDPCFDPTEAQGG